MLLNLLLKQIMLILLILCYPAHSERWESGLHQRYDGYGEDWIFMPDGNGQPQVAVLKDNERRSILKDSEIAYIIYTRYLIAMWYNNTLLFRLYIVLDITKCMQ